MSKNVRRRLSLTEVSEITGVDRSTVITFIEREWICPVAPLPSVREVELDQEDLARIHLIQELRSDFGANDEAIPLILHLVDQLYWLEDQVKKHGIPK